MLGTPHVLDGRVYSVVQVGNTVILGGRFTQAREEGSAAVQGRRNLMAFDATTGKISAAFTPNPDGDVNVVLPVGDGKTVYVGGAFTDINGVKRQRLARIRISDGSVVGSFAPKPINNEVRDLRRAGKRLWVAGTFSKVGSKSRVGLVTLKASTGALLRYQGLKFAGTQNGGRTTVDKIDLNPKRNRLIALGNFRSVGGVARRQLVMLDLSGAKARLAKFRTKFYGRRCGLAWNSYVRDLAFSPDGKYFVVTTTGGYRGAGAPCDSAARFETKAKGSAVPSWVDNTGGDTQYAVEITRSAVYVGGHARWQNNPFRNNDVGPGAVRREGIAALDPLNGLPYSWDPTRQRGVGVFDLLVNSLGLWIASDTEKVDGQLRSRIALLPPGGRTFASVATPTLPGQVYATDTGTDGINRRSFDGAVVGPAKPVVAPTWGGGRTTDDIRGAFMINGWLYLAWKDGTLDRRTFNGTTYGSPVPVDTHHELVELTAWKDDIRSMTGMFFDRGRLYFTKAGSTTLHYRYFTPESDVVGAERHTAATNIKGIDYRKVRGMFVARGKLYWSLPNGKLRRMDWVSGAAKGRVVAGTARTVSSPAGGVDWSAPRSLFVFQGTP